MTTSRWKTIMEEIKCTETEAKLCTQVMQNLDIYKSCALNMPNEVKNYMITEAILMIGELSK